MPIPLNEVTQVQISVLGIAAAGGSSITPCINVFNFRRIAVAVDPTKAALNTAFQAAIIIPLLAASNVRYTPSRLTIRWLNDALDPPQEFPVAGVGAIVTDSMPSDDAIYMLMRSALRGRNYQGSKHFGQGSEVDTTNDLLTGAGLARWVTMRNAVAANIVDATPNTWVPIVLSRNLSQLQKNPTFVSSADVVSVLLDLNIGTMRRRRSATIR